MSDEGCEDRLSRSRPQETDECGFSLEAELEALAGPRRPPPPLLVVISGPSGVGKDAVLSRMKQLGRPHHFVVTVTTRLQRPGERDGVDYYFVSRARFEDMIAHGELMEWANVYGNYYGVPWQQVRAALARGLDVIVKPDVQGAATIKELVPEGVFIFLAPPSIEELSRRLRRRRTESPADLDLRLRTSLSEMACLPMFDYVVVNYDGGLDETVARVEAIITAEKCRVRPRVLSL